MKKLVWILVLSLSAALLSACQPAGIEVTRVVTEQVEVTRIVEGQTVVEEVEVTRIVMVPSEDSSAAQEKTLVIAKGAIPTTGDPAYDTGAWAMASYIQIFDTLVVFRDGAVQPSVATSWETVDELTWEFHLRDDVVFQNGEPLNAQAVKFTLDRILDADEAIPWRAQVASITGVEVVNDTTLRITTDAPFGPLVQTLMVAFIIPPDYYREVGKDAFAERPVGSGPFRWVDFDPSTHLTVEAWPDSWRWHGQEPGLDQVTWRKLAEDSTRVSALEAGEVDVVEDVPPEMVARLEQRGLDVISQPIAQTLVVNLRSTWDTPLADMRVRQAINYAIDKEALLESIALGHGTLVNSQLIGADSFGFHPDLEPYPYDPDKARELFAEAGYPNGFEATFHFSVGRYPKDKEVSEAIAAQLADVGIIANLEFLENVVFSQMSREGTAGPLQIYGWQTMPAMDINQPVPFFKCETPRKNFCDARLDELIEEMQSTLDAQEREEVAREMAAYLAETAPVVFLWQFHTIYGIQPYVDGFAPTAARVADLTLVTVNR